ncbi:hypothetical protein Taro_041333, partial [Colocasia esculenta]|nr:hypothetical protein [Colocasia esculenta]
FLGRAVCAGVGRRPFRGFPKGVSCAPLPAGLVVVISQLCRFLWWLPRQFSFAQCSTLEGLSAGHVVTVTWDPQPRAPMLEGVASGSGCAQVTDLEQKGKTVGVAASAICRALLAGLGLQGTSGVVLQLGRSAVVCGCVLGCDSLASLYRGGCRRESAAGVLEAWMGCFHILFDSAGSAGVVLGLTLVFCFRFVGVPTALAGKGLVIPTEPCSRGSPPTLFRWLAFQQGPSVSCRRVLLLLLGARATSVVAIFARAAVGFVLGLRVCLGLSRRLREPTCDVAFTGVGLWSAEPVEGVLTLLVVPLLWGESLLDVPLLLRCVLVGCPLIVWVCARLVVCLALCAYVPLCTVLCSVDVVARAKQMLVCRVAPLVELCDTWLRCISWLPCVLVHFLRTVGCCPGEVRSQDYFGLVSAGCCATSGL